jgi:glycosyltransferase involved in cell wall biosynthesis
VLANIKNQVVVMICTAARGGMRSVVERYSADGLFSRWNVVLLSSHIEGGFILRLTTAAQAFFLFIGLLLRRRVSLVHCHAAMRGSFWRKSLFSLTARAAGVPVIFHLHGSEMKTFVDKQPVFLRRFISWILAKQSVVIVLTDSWRIYIKSISPRASIQVLSNYVDLPALSENASKYNDTDVHLLFLGLVGMRKGVYDLLPAFRDAITKVPGLRLIIGGNGEVGQAKVLAAQLNIDDRVLFAGWVSGEDKINYLCQADIYILPSYNEGLPVSLLEAMSWQIPVISTRVGGIPELVRDGIDGLLVDAGDHAAISSAIIKLSQDAGLRRQMGKAARDQVECNFSKQVVLPKIEELYSSLIFRNNVIVSITP